MQDISSNGSSQNGASPVRRLYKPHRKNTADIKPRLFAFLATMANGILAGIMFSLGATAYLSVDSKYLGSAVFSVGMFLVLNYGFGFFTSKVGYCFNQKSEQNLTLIPIWLGNVSGAVITGLLILLTREEYYLKLFERANQLCGAKLEDNALSIIVLSIFCGLIMFIITDTFKNAKNTVQKYLIPLLLLMVFSLCGFEHFVSSTFYFVVANAVNIKAVWYILLMTLGNSLGAVIIPLSHKGINILREMSKSSN